MFRIKAVFLPVVFFIVFGIFGCTPKLIPGTKIKDTPDTRAIAVLVTEKYRRAMESKDIDTIMSLASTKYYEDESNTDSTDDFNYAGLKEKLKSRFKIVKTVILDITLADVIADREKGTATVKYHYILKFLVNYPSIEKWEVSSDDAKMELVLENGEWKVLKGL